jgi:formiminotetrahydrofolate cyclodeaminase
MRGREYYRVIIRISGYRDMARKILLDEYLKRLADKTPVPGGGSAAALTAALGACLISMSAKYILKKVKGKNAAQDLCAIIRFNEKSLRRLGALMKEDEQAYLRLAMELEKRNPKNLLKLYKDAAAVPLEVCGISVRAVSGCVKLCRCAETMIISDIAEAAILLESAFFCAKLNVEINLGGIKDSAYKGKVERELKMGSRRVRSAKIAALKMVRKFLRRG